MRTTLLFLALACFTMLGCKKNEYNNTNTNPNPNAMTYVINGLTDITMDYDAEKMIPLSIERTAGTQEKLTLSVSGLPGQTTAAFDVASGIPNFATVLTLTTNYADGGSYDIKVTGTTESGSMNSYNLKLKINPEPPMGCAEKMFGNYTAKYEGSISYQNESVKAESTGTKNQVRFKGFKIFDVVGDIDCDLHTINVKSQTTGNNIYLSGSGTFDDKHITLNMFIKDQNGNQLAYYICYMER